MDGRSARADHSYFHRGGQYEKEKPGIRGLAGIARNENAFDVENASV